MKRFVMFALISAVAVCAIAESVLVSLPTDIPSVDAFVAFRNDTATTPEGGAAVFVLAMLLYETDEALGHDAMVIALDAGELRSDANGYRGYTLGNRAREFVTRYLIPKPYLARSYLIGTSSESGYEIGDDWTVSLSQNRYSQIAEDRIKVFVVCSGADSDRPITLKRNNRGVWKAYEYSSLFVGIRPPVEVADDPL